MTYLVMHEVTGSESVFMSTFDTLREALRRCLELAQTGKSGCLFYDKPVIRQSDEILSWG